MNAKTLGLLALLTLACDQPAVNMAPNAASFEQFQRAACRHEIGHAVYALQFPKYIQLTRTYLVADPGSHNGAFTEFNFIERADDFRQTVVLVGMNLAGEVGEEILGGASVNGTGSNDRTEAAKLATRLLDGKTANVPLVLAATKELARDILAPHAADLRRLADELYRRKKLTAQDVRQILNER